MAQLNYNKISFRNNQELLEILSNVKQSSQPLTLENTIVKNATKKSRETKEPYSVVFPSPVYVTEKLFVRAFVNYEKQVNKVRENEGKEADFKSQSLPWGKYVEGAEGFIIEHNGEYYLRYYEKMNANYKYSERLWHFENGNELTSEEKENFKKNFGDKKYGNKIQGVSIENEVNPKSTKFSGIIRLVIGGMVLIRSGYENREEKSQILKWHLNKIIN